MRLLLENSPHAVALLVETQVALVFAPGDLAVNEQLSKRVAPNRKQRPQDEHLLQRRLRAHCFEARWTGSAKEPLHDGLGLIVGMMGEDHALQLSFLNHATKQFQPQRAEARGAIAWKAG